MPWGESSEAPRFSWMLEGADPLGSRALVPPTEPGQVARVQACHPGALRFDVERCDVGKADDPLRMLAKRERADGVGDSRETVAAARCDHRPGRRVDEGGPQFFEPPRVRTSEKALPPEE